MDKKEYFRLRHIEQMKGKTVNPEMNDITQRLFRIQQKYKTTKTLLRTNLVYFYHCLGLEKTEIAKEINCKLETIYNCIFKIEKDAIVWRSKEYYLAKDIKEFANEYKAKI